VQIAAAIAVSTLILVVVPAGLPTRRLVVVRLLTARVAIGQGGGSKTATVSSTTVTLPAAAPVDIVDAEGGQRVGEIVAHG
jgi:hypothetical protein